jgi:hypothetical protein
VAEYRDPREVDGLLDNALVRRFAELLGMPAREDRLTRVEEDRARELVRQRDASDGFTYRR